MVLPWTLIALVAVILPFFRSTRDRSTDSLGRELPRRDRSAHLWFAWWWGVGNLAVFCFWSVAKPNYYVPCLPGMALLIGVDLGGTGAGWRVAGAAARPWSRERSCSPSGSCCSWPRLWLRSLCGAAA